MHGGMFRCHLEEIWLEIAEIRGFAEKSWIENVGPEFRTICEYLLEENKPDEIELVAEFGGKISKLALQMEVCGL